MMCGRCRSMPMSKNFCIPLIRSFVSWILSLEPDVAHPVYYIEEIRIYEQTRASEAGHGEQGCSGRLDRL